ncbi:ABC transporter substrate-binding protein [Haloechinothrix halophila]|uniref:ABC transporter substrate-binding protein n=1 Tax=Haloechinothrix halophila TaxID=1069073 RepID=UPI00146FBD35|nr:ABC transporter substrate-binding protein [Haloechinothrix halophila]
MTILPTARSLLSRTSLTQLGALAVAAAVALTGCGGAGGSDGGAAGDAKTMTIALDADAAPNGYDPLVYAQYQSQFFSALYDSLFVTQEDGSVAPSLVTEFSTSEDNTQLTLKLREGVTFTDGSTLDSTLVKDNLDRRDNPELTSYGVFAEGDSAEIAEVAAPDPRTVVITWAEPQAAGQNNLADTAGMIVGATAIEDPGTLTTTPAGSGPYTLNKGQTTKPNTYTLDKKPDAWNADNYPFETVVYKTITDDQALANAVVSGQADVALPLDPDTVDMVESQQTVAENGGTLFGFLVFDKTGATSEPFGDVRVRKALSYAIDRQSIVDNLHPGDKPTANMVSSESSAYDPSLDEEFAYDPDRAKQLLAEAGYPDGFSFDKVTPGKPTADEVAVQRQWEQIGVTMNLNPASSTDAVFAAARTQPLGFGPFAFNDLLGFVQGVVYGGFMNLQEATNPEIEAAMAAAAEAAGGGRTEAVQDLNRAIVTEGWYIPMYESFTYAGYNASKVTEPKFGGTNNYIMLSSLRPAG